MERTTETKTVVETEWKKENIPTIKMMIITWFYSLVNVLTLGIVCLSFKETIDDGKTAVCRVVCEYE